MEKLEWLEGLAGLLRAVEGILKDLRLGILSQSGKMVIGYKNGWSLTSTSHCREYWSLTTSPTTYFPPMTLALSILRKVDLHHFTKLTTSINTKVALSTLDYFNKLKVAFHLPTSWE
jgi:hypothetical protein